jgi:hypothetical protein
LERSWSGVGAELERSWSGVGAELEGSWPCDGVAFMLMISSKLGSTLGSNLGRRGRVAEKATMEHREVAGNLAVSAVLHGFCHASGR